MQQSYHIKRIHYDTRQLLEEQMDQIRKELLEQLDTLMGRLTENIGENTDTESDNKDYPALSAGWNREPAIHDIFLSGAMRAAGRVQSPDAGLRQLAHVILRRTGRNIGNQLGEWLFDRQFEPAHYARHQLTEQLLGGLLKGQRNR